ncbi:MAG: phosphotransferase [Pseudonocardiales bacterium]|nr:phosphotransferase [Pseudonocardiales bacterium]
MGRTTSCSTRTLTVIAVLDWEWAHPGDPVEDLAWCEWIVRSYHAEHVNTLDGFFSAYGRRPAWSVRHQQMISQARWLAEMTERWEIADEDRVQTRWRQLAATEAWAE